MREFDVDKLRVQGYPRALSKAWDDISKLNPDTICKNAIAEYDDERKEFSISFLNQTYTVSMVEKGVLLNEGKVNPFISIIILHYLTSATCIPLSKKLISFRELYGGDVYYKAFFERAIKPIAESFGESPELLIDAGKSLGGREVRHGDYGIEIKTFPRIPVYVFLWVGDDEIPSSSNILFDSTVGEHLHTEDISKLGAIVSKELIKFKEEN